MIRKWTGVLDLQVSRHKKGNEEAVKVIPSVRDFSVAL